MRRHYLSKSRILSGWQCHRKLWLEVHAPDEGRRSAETERAFRVGHDVGELARRLFPGGTLVEHDQALGEALAETRRLLARPGPVTLYEATFRHEGVLFRADVLVRDESGRVRLIEVKASTSVKPVHEIDCAVQAWVLAGSGHRLSSVELAHVNSDFVYAGGDDYEGLLVLADLTDAVAPMVEGVPAWIAEYRAALSGSEPAIRIGPQCTDPYECQFLAHCGACLPPYPVTRLPGSKRVAWQLLDEGVEDIREIPEGRLENETQERVRRITAAGEPELDPAAAAELDALPWPRRYLDFETVAFAVPVWAGTRPYEALPFQWSCHLELEDGRLEHAAWLAEGDGPPMRGFAESLLESTRGVGPVLVYTGYEARILGSLAERYPELAPELEALAGRLYDLHPVTRRSYYHPDMLGSWSIKSVLPTIAPELDYAGLEEVREGGAAAEAFIEIMAEDTPPARRARLREALLAYCARDTLAMVALARHLSGRPVPG